MASAPFETVILTVALYGILLIALTMFSTVSTIVTRDSFKIRLQEVANQVVMEITTVYSLCQQSTGDIGLFKQIEVPTSIYEKGYVIEVKKETVEVRLEGELKTLDMWVVEARLQDSSGLKSISFIWDGNVPINVETSDGYFQINSKTGIYSVKHSNILSSGADNLVVWAKKNAGEIIVGIGTAEKVEGV
ncbi:MAG: hypothetical protein QW385_06900 [Thermoproteota archaeon]